MPEHQPRTSQKRERERGWEAVWVTAKLYLTPCHFLGARHSHSQPARAVDEVSWGTKQSKRNQGGFLSLGVF